MSRVHGQRGSPGPHPELEKLLCSGECCSRKKLTLVGGVQQTPPRSACNKAESKPLHELLMLGEQSCLCSASNVVAPAMGMERAHTEGQG